MRVGQWLAREEKDAGGAMAGANWHCRYGCPRRQNMNGGHGKVEELTASPAVVVAVSGRALKRVVDGGRELEREVTRG